MPNEEELNGNGNDPLLAHGREDSVPPANEPTAVPEPSGPPQPVVEKPTPGCGCTGTTIALLLAGGAGLLLLPALYCSPTMGATRSARIEREKRAVEIERAWAESQSAPQDDGHAHLDDLSRSR